MHTEVLLRYKTQEMPKQWVPQSPLATEKENHTANNLKMITDISSVMMCMVYCKKQGSTHTYTFRLFQEFPAIRITGKVFER